MAIWKIPPKWNRVVNVLYILVVYARTESSSISLRSELWNIRFNMFVPTKDHWQRKEHWRWKWGGYKTSQIIFKGMILRWYEANEMVVIRFTYSTGALVPPQTEATALPKIPIRVRVMEWESNSERVIACICVYVYVRICVCICVYMYVCMCAYVREREKVCACICECVCAHARVWACVYILSMSIWV